MTLENARPEVTIGAQVFTADGEDLGHVKEVASGAFKIDASLQPDYWLPGDCIGSTTVNEVRLSLTQDQLSEAKVDPPGDSGVVL